MSGRSESHIVVFKSATSTEHKTGEPFLAKITRNDHDSVDITATDGDSIYTKHLSENDIASFHKGTDGRNDWHNVFFSIITNQPVAGHIYETRVSRNPDSIAAVLRDISNETPLKVAVLDIPVVDDIELNLFDWTVQASDTIQASRAIDQRMRLELDRIETEKAELGKQLDDLRAAKLQHENQMLEGFAKLLNSKKAHIRELRKTSKTPKTSVDTTSHNRERNVRDSDSTDHWNNNIQRASTDDSSERESADSDEMRDVSPAKASIIAMTQSDEGEDEEL